MPWKLLSMLGWVTMMMMQRTPHSYIPIKHYKSFTHIFVFLSVPFEVWICGQNENVCMSSKQ